MKTKALFIALAVMLSSIAVQAQSNSMFEKLSGNKDITSVFVSKALLSMVPDMDAGGVNVKAFANKLDRLEVYTSENKDAIKLMTSEADKLIKNNTYETLMSMQEDGEKVLFYAQKSGNDNFKELLMYVIEPDDCTIIRIIGNFTAADLQKMIESAQ